MKATFIYFLRKALPAFILFNFVTGGLMILIFHLWYPLWKFLLTQLLVSIFFYVTSAGFYAYTIKLGTISPTKFVNGYMILSIAKLLIYLLALLLCLYIFRSQLKMFLIQYMLNYLFFTIFEIILVTRALKKLQNNQPNTK
jgi:hypothetical protein